MTYEESLTYRQYTPVQCADNETGLLIRWANDSVGVQVYRGNVPEEYLRWIPLNRLKDLNPPYGALYEVPERGGVL